MEKKKALILLSGGLDSTVVLANALEKKCECLAITFDYGQRHLIEVNAAKKIAAHYQVSHHVIKIDPFSFAGSALTTSEEKVPHGRKTTEILTGGIPPTYVPARNTLFLSYCLAQAESIHANEIHIGMNAQDRGGYPDCRPEFINAFQALINVATKQSLEETPPQLITPLIDLNKKEIILLGIKLNAPLEMTHSCYSPNKEGLPCRQCDACILREKGFEEASEQLG